MKKILTFLFCIALLTSCEDKGVTKQWLSGDESTLPQELKGLKVYTVSTGDGNYVKVGILNNQAISTTYKSGKHSQSVILVDKETTTTINVESLSFCLSFFLQL